jgi:hypothetical protein
MGIYSNCTKAIRPGSSKSKKTPLGASTCRKIILPFHLFVGEMNVTSRYSRMRGRTLILTRSLNLGIFCPLPVHSFLPSTNRSIVACRNKQIP